MIKKVQYFGERPLYCVSNETINNIRIMDGESGFKECKNMTVGYSEFHGKYPFWHDEHVSIHDSYFSEGSRAAIWYSNEIELKDSIVEAPKILREASNIHIINSRFETEEMLWDCQNVDIKDSTFTGDYLLLHSEKLDVDGLELEGNYSFQHVRNSTFRNIRIQSKDAFWNTKNVTVYDSVIRGKYLGWYSKNLKFVRCQISGTQPLSYANGLVLEDCEIIEGDLCFEHSDVIATINGSVDSIKNPKGGKIVVDHVNELIVEEGFDNEIVVIRNPVLA